MNGLEHGADVDMVTGEPTEPAQREKRSPEQAHAVDRGARVLADLGAQGGPVMAELVKALEARIRFVMEKDETCVLFTNILGRLNYTVDMAKKISNSYVPEGVELPE